MDRVMDKAECPECEGSDCRCNVVSPDLNITGEVLSTETIKQLREERDKQIETNIRELTHDKQHDDLHKLLDFFKYFC